MKRSVAISFMILFALSSCKVQFVNNRDKINCDDGSSAASVKKCQSGATDPQPSTSPTASSNPSDTRSLQATLSLSTDRVTQGGSVTVTVTVAGLSAGESLSDLGVAFTAAAGSFGKVTYPKANKAQATYSHNTPGQQTISVKIAGEAFPSVTASLQVLSILAGWRDSLPAVFSSDQSLRSFDAEYPQVAMDDNNNALIVWVQSDGLNDQVFKSEYRSGSWTHPSGFADNISPNGSKAKDPQVAMDANSNALIVWSQRDGSYDYQIFMSEYRAGSWTHPSGLADNISPDGQFAYTPQVAMDNNNNALIVWRQSDGSDDQIFKSEYRSSGGWTHPSGLSDNISPDGESAYNPQVAMDPSGNGLIVWDQSDGSNKQVFMSEYRAGAWTHPAGLTDNISPDGQDANAPQVAMDVNGNALIVWDQFDGSAYQIFKSEYRSGSWTHPSGLADNISPDGQHAFSPQVAMDSNNNALIVWNQSDGSNNQIFKSEYRSGGWTHPSGLTDNISPDGQIAQSQQVAMDSNNNALIVWRQSDGSDDQLFVSEYRSGSWTHPSGLTDNISPDGSHIQRPQVAMDASNNALIVWYQYDGSNFQVFMSEYRSGSWTHPSGLADDISAKGQYADGPQVAIDANANAVITWSQYDGSNYQIFKSEYRSGNWVHPSGLADNISPDGENASDPQVAMDANDNALIVWQQYDGSSVQIFMSEYRLGSWTHPSGLADNISPDGASAYNPKVVMDANNNALIAWRQYDGSTYQIFKSEYRSGSWTHPTGLTDNISPDGVGVDTAPVVAIDDNNNALIVWRQYDGSSVQIFMSEYRSGSWTHPSGLADNISPDGQAAFSPQVAMDANNNALIVWRQFDGSDHQIFKSEYRSGSWTHPSSSADNISPDGQHASAPQVAMDHNHNALIVWHQSDGSHDQIFKSEYRSGSWTHPSSLADNISPDGIPFSNPQVLFNSNGDAHIVATSLEQKLYIRSFYGNQWQNSGLEAIPGQVSPAFSFDMAASDSFPLIVYGTATSNPRETGVRVVEWETPQI